MSPKWGAAPRQSRGPAEPGPDRRRYYAPPARMSDSPTDPIEWFRRELQRAREREPFDATACALGTVDAEGLPAVRFVLLKDADARGFVFYTNYGSRKAADIGANPNVALAFHWPTLGEQVRVEGPAERVPAEESDAYFASRPRGSQIGAWTSRQSEPVDSRATIEARYRETEQRFAGQPVPRPPFWGGYRVRPRRIEIWRAGDHRLHDRFSYVRDGEGYRVERLQP